MARKRSYIFTGKKNPPRAIMATILGVISLLSMGIVIYLSYRREGDVPAGYGVTGLLAVFFSVTGLILGILTARVKENFRLFPWLGIALNLLALLLIGFIVYMGT